MQLGMHGTTRLAATGHTFFLSVISDWTGTRVSINLSLLELGMRPVNTATRSGKGHVFWCYNRVISIKEGGSGYAVRQTEGRIYEYE